MIEQFPHIRSLKNAPIEQLSSLRGAKSGKLAVLFANFMLFKARFGRSIGRFAAC